MMQAEGFYRAKDDGAAKAQGFLKTLLLTPGSKAIFAFTGSMVELWPNVRWLTYCLQSLRQQPKACDAKTRSQAFSDPDFHWQIWSARYGLPYMAHTG